MNNILEKIKDVIDLVDDIPSTPTLLMGVIIGSLIPFKLILLCATGVAIWAGLKYYES
jgi:hypothetical protein